MSGVVGISPSAMCSSVAANSSGVYPSTNCRFSSFTIPISGWIVSGSMHTPTTTIRVPRGAAAITWSSTPGTPTHSKTTGVRPAGRCSHTVVLAGSTTTWAPSVVASSRRRGEKSAATMGSTLSRRSAAITARPTGPQPMTNGASSGARRAFCTAWTPTAIGSVRAAWSVASPLGTGSSSPSLRRMYWP